MNDLVSIIIPTKNSARTLEATLKSIDKQTHQNLELIVVDNISADATPEIVKAFKKSVNFPVALLEGEFKNTPHARMSGTHKTSGNHVFHVDSDMQLDSHVVAECLEKIKEGHGSVIIPERSFGKGFWTACKCLERACYDNDDDVESARFFPRNIYFKVGGHDKNILFAEDKDLDLRVRKAGYSVGRINALIMHDEGQVKFLNLMKKKYRYARSAMLYMRSHPGNLAKQANLFRPAYFRNWRLLAKQPHLSIPMFFMKFCEFSSMGISAVLNGVAFLMKKK